MGGAKMGGGIGSGDSEYEYEHEHEYEYERDRSGLSPIRNAAREVSLAPRD
jgi:hypothetical protein